MFILFSKSCTIEEKTGERMSSLKQRRYRRKYIGKTLEYRVESSAEDEMYDGILFDISEAGLSIIAVNPLQEGQTIFMKSTVALPTNIAIVQWCKNYYDLYYKIGLQCV